MQLQRERGIITNYFLERRYGSSGGKVALTYFFMPMSLIPPEAKLQSTYFHLYADVKFTLIVDKYGRQQASRVVIQGQETNS